MKLASYFDDQVKTILPMIGVDLVAENQLSKDLLGMTYERSIEDSIIAMGHSLITKGLVTEKRPEAERKTGFE